MKTRTKIILVIIALIIIGALWGKNTKPEEQPVYEQGQNTPLAAEEEKESQVEEITIKYSPDLGHLGFSEYSKLSDTRRA